MAARAEGGRGPCGEVCVNGDVLGPAGWKGNSDIEKKYCSNCYLPYFQIAFQLMFSSQLHGTGSSAINNVERTKNK
jgi:hypothetical protein